MSFFSNETKFFYELTPDRILDAVEAGGLKPTGYTLQLNSMENRVFEVGVEVDDYTLPPRHPSRFRVIKFYRPGRWSKEQILEEHEFLSDLKDEDLSVGAPMVLKNGSTVERSAETDLLFAIFEKIGGRLNPEPQDEDLERIGRLIARVHLVGARKEARHRLALTPASYGLENLDVLLKLKAIEPQLESTYARAVEELVRKSEPLFKGVQYQRIHGDCHLGNVLWGSTGPFLVDFDDMVSGPCAQDLWLIAPGDDLEAKTQLDIIVEAYESIKKFDRRTLKLIPCLRALRFVHFNAWIAKRWQDPAFKRAFPHFDSSGYWSEQLGQLKDEIDRVESR